MDPCSGFGLGPFHAGGISAQLELGLALIFFLRCPHPSTFKSGSWTFHLIAFHLITFATFVAKPRG